MPSTSSWPMAHRFRSPAPLLAVLDTGLRLGSRPLPLQSRAPRCHRDALSLEGALECGAMQRFRVAFKFKTALRVNFLLCPRVSLRKRLEVAPRSAPRMRFNVGACNPRRLRDKAACTSAGDLPWVVNPKTKSNSADERCGAIAKRQHRMREREAQETMCSLELRAAYLRSSVGV